MMVPAEELPVLESLVQIRNRLTRLKKDRSEYIRARDVLDTYSLIMSEVHRLNEIRAPAEAQAEAEYESGASVEGAVAPEEAKVEPEASTSTLAPPPPPTGIYSTGRSRVSTPAQGEDGEEPEAENRVDTILNDVFQLLSLFFLRIGKLRESPATFCQLATMKRLLLHVTESGIYTAQDLKPYRARLTELRTIILTSSSRPDEDANTREEEDLRTFLLSKWSSCNRLLSKLEAGVSKVSPELVPLQQRLITLRRSLAAVAARIRPSSADVAHILAELRHIEDGRVNGKFVIEDEEGNQITPEKGQALCAGLLEYNFEICQDLKARDGEENVARGPLQPIYDRLNELKAQLERLVLTHRWTLRETDLYNYQVILREIDNMRVNGKFVDADGNVPEGQLILLYLLRRCYGLCYRLMSSSEPISEELMPVANKLNTVKRCLAELQKYGGPYNGRDLYPYQLVLSQIDELRKDGRFEGRDGTVPEGQGILNALLSEAHEMISVLMEEGE